MAKTKQQRRWQRMLDDMEACISDYEAKGWPSEEVKHWAQFTRNSLWVMANNREPDDLSYKLLARDSDNLAAAKAKAAGASNVKPATRRR